MQPFGGHNTVQILFRQRNYSKDCHEIIHIIYFPILIMIVKDIPMIETMSAVTDILVKCTDFEKQVYDFDIPQNETNQCF